MSSDNVAELFLLGTLFLVKMAIKKSNEKEALPLQEFSKSRVISPNNADFTPKKGEKIIVEGIIDTDSPIEYKYEDPFQTENRINNTIKLITLIQMRTPFYFNPFGKSSNEYYEEVDSRPNFKNNKSGTKTITKSKNFYLRDYHKPDKKAIIKNNMLEDNECFSMEFLNFIKTYHKINLLKILRVSEYGIKEKHIGVPCGRFMGVYGEFERNDGVLRCEKPLIFFHKKQQVIEKMNKDLENGKIIQVFFDSITYLAVFFWGIQKGRNIYSYITAQRQHN